MLNYMSTIIKFFFLPKEFKNSVLTVVNSFDKLRKAM